MMTPPTTTLRLLLVSLTLCLPLVSCWSVGGRPSHEPLRDALLRRRQEEGHLAKDSSAVTPTPSRRHFFAFSASLWFPFSAFAKCTDIETCREIGERKDAENQAASPVVRLGNGLQYKVLRPGLGSDTVSNSSLVKLIYSISQANGSYMYSKGFGYNKVDAAGDGKMVSDLGVDSIVVKLGDKDIPVGIQKAMVGMKRAERRRIECPPSVGFETSDWNPEPTTFRGKQQIKDYKNTLYGRGPSQPAFPAPTIWDVEVLNIR